MSAVPRPFPIIRVPSDFKGDVQVVLRVIERGHEDHHEFLVLGSRWEEELPRALDHLVQRARLEVGVRHGTWICHVVPMEWHHGRYMPIPPICREIRRREPREWRTISYEGRIDIDGFNDPLVLDGRQP